MSRKTSRLSKLSAIKLALAAHEARGKTEVAKAEPLAIIGAGCRFPGKADSPDAFWQLLREGKEAVVEVPSDRWDANAFYDPVPRTPGKMISRCGGFVGNLREFDADFFGISPREAVTVDPQQRLLLEVVWEALENAGIPADSLDGSDTGAFVGISGIDYLMHLQACNREIDAYSGTGTALSVAAGRLSYVFGLRGPSMSVDTACSSSLVAVHMACQALRSRECDLAIAGGTHRILLPHGSIALSQASLLAPDGRCKTFDARADGYVRGEGCGIVLLKRLSDAIADGDDIVAVVRGSAVNQDGRTSGLTVPNGPAQQEVIRRALRNAAVDADQIGYVEAHGTGTPLGDPIEAMALASVFERPPDAPLLIGSVKTNFGHLEASAGIAGLLKVVLALKHREIPPHLHFQKPNPHVPWQSVPIKVATEPTPWPVIDGRRIGGISSFSFSGTNAHAVLEETPGELLAGGNGRSRSVPYLLALSAKSAPALQDLAARYRDYLAAADAPFGDICCVSGAGRKHFAERLSVVAASAEEARDRLAGWLSGEQHPSVFEGRRTREPSVGFVFDEDVAGAGRAAQQLGDIDPQIRGMLERAAGLGDTEARIFTIQCALASMWRRLGIDPHFVAGRGIGQFAAACVAGVFDIEEGLALLSGAQPSAMSCRKAWTGLLAPEGAQIGDAAIRPQYWARVLSTLQGDRRDRPAGKNACDVVLVIGATELAIGHKPEHLPFVGKLCLATLSDDVLLDGRVTMNAMAFLYCAGAAPNWRSLHGDLPRPRPALPNYPFQRQRYWVDGVPLMQGQCEGTTGEGAQVRRPAPRYTRATVASASGEHRRKLLEAYLTDQMAEIFNRPEAAIDPDEPLRALGIDSLMAAEFKYRIEEDLAIRFDLQNVDAECSLNDLIGQIGLQVDMPEPSSHEPRIGFLRNDKGEVTASVFVAHEQGGRVPLFLVHPGGIDIAGYGALAGHLPADQPLYVLQPNGLYGATADGTTTVQTSIEHAATICAELIKILRKEVPYQLAGWSLGALVAYEIARQLRSAGSSVPILICSTSPAARRATARRCRRGLPIFWRRGPAAR